MKIAQRNITVNYQRCPTEKYARDSSGVRLKFLASEKTIEDQTRVWKCRRLDSDRSDGARVGCVGSSQSGKHWVVVRSIGGSVAILVAEISKREIR